ncbi:MAG TPA: hypothetical protein VGY54_20940 [Polyangiaceae bacterium]|jgi:hypothetical protein|nr:hypothetical protein [Polyangiaceae bacterium]
MRSAAYRFRVAAAIPPAVGPFIDPPSDCDRVQTYDRPLDKCPNRQPKHDLRVSLTTCDNDLTDGRWSRKTIVASLFDALVAKGNYVRLITGPMATIRQPTVRAISLIRCTGCFRAAGWPSDCRIA